jgi:hypothetical protein
MSFLKQANINANKDEFWSGQAIVETKFSVGDMTAARTSKVNSKKLTIGNRSANAANTGMQVNYLCVFWQSANTMGGTTPPVVFDSLTGIGYDAGVDTKYSKMKQMTLAGRLQSSVNYEGTVPHQRDISVQCGGMCAIRMFTKGPTESVSWMDRLMWTIPDFDNETMATAQYRHLLGLARQEFPVGKIPILVERMKAELFYEFPREAMKHFVKKITNKDTFDYFFTEKAKKSADPLDDYILSNFLGPVKLAAALFEFIDDDFKSSQAAFAKHPGLLSIPANGGRADFRKDTSLEQELFNFSSVSDPNDREKKKQLAHYFAALYMNIGLFTSWEAAKQVISNLHKGTDFPAFAPHLAFVDRMDAMGKVKRDAVMNIATNAMIGQYDAFTFLRDHNFGKALSVGHPGDGLRILFRI